MRPLETIGFYTLSDKRAAEASPVSRLFRCELLLTSRCNFTCPYCRRVGGQDVDFREAADLIRQWGNDNLFAIRFSGGEPLAYPRLRELVRVARDSHIERVAVSTNGSFPLEEYKALIDAGADDFSISLDGCCAADGDRMAGVSGSWETVVSNIRELSKSTYVTVGVVLTDDNASSVRNIVRLAAGLGVADIRIIPAAQHGRCFSRLEVDPEDFPGYPILKYRLENFRSGRAVRGLCPTDCNRCALVLDDMAVCEGRHYPCIIYLREGGEPIGRVGPNVRRERARWFAGHDTHDDPVCSRNCLDVCVDYNNRMSTLTGSS